MLKPKNSSNHVLLKFDFLIKKQFIISSASLRQNQLHKRYFSKNNPEVNKLLKPCGHRCFALSSEQEIV